MESTYKQPFDKQDLIPIIHDLFINEIKIYKKKQDDNLFSDPSMRDLYERLIVLEEELKNQRILMDDRFKQMQYYLEKRFEQVDKRFEQVDKRFEQVDKRFDRIYRFMQWQTGLGLAAMIGIYLKLFFG